MADLKGVNLAMQTPFRSDGSVDSELLTFRHKK